VVKDNAIEMLATEDGDPLLAFWPIGLGRSAVFASDVKDRWATDWLKWKGYGPFFASVVRAIARQRAAGVGVEVVSGVARGSTRPLTVTVEARDAHGNYLDRLKPSVVVEAADGRKVSQTARQVAPGRYEARVVADAAQPLTVTVDGGETVRATRLIIPDVAAEYRFRTPDDAGLAAIAQATGGRVGATARSASPRLEHPSRAQRAMALARARGARPLVLRHPHQAGSLLRRRGSDRLSSTRMVAVGQTIAFAVVAAGLATLIRWSRSGPPPRLFR
jgi:hypothetical protein